MSIVEEMDLTKNIDWTPYGKRLDTINKPYADANQLLSDATAQVEAAQKDYDATKGQPVTLDNLEKQDAAKSKLDRLKRVREATSNNVDKVKADNDSNTAGAVTAMRDDYIAAVKAAGADTLSKIKDLERQLAMAETEYSQLWDNASQQWSDYVTPYHYQARGFTGGFDKGTVMVQGNYEHLPVLGVKYVNSLIKEENENTRTVNEPATK